MRSPPSVERLCSKPSLEMPPLPPDEWPSATKDSRCGELSQPSPSPREQPCSKLSCKLPLLPPSEQSRTVKDAWCDALSLPLALPSPMK